MAGKPIIGVAGGIGSGKSTVASILVELGAAVIDADRLNHEVLNAPEVLARLEAWWGPGVLTPEGRADRDAIRRIVTNDANARHQLENLVHPRIARQSDELMRQYQADPDVRAVVWDAPLLFEAGLAERCEYILYVEASASTRRRRVLPERGWTAEELERFQNSQMPLSEKRARADFIVVNDSDIEGLREQVREVFARIVADRRGPSGHQATPRRT